MCGIFGYVGPDEAIPLVLNGLESLEYRGYDSSGLAAISGGNLVCVKEVGKIARLKGALGATPHSSHLAISQTRWATHGKPTAINAHPHLDESGECAVVHNGIIENFDAVRRMLEKRGIAFRSHTDTEVISQLIGFLYKDSVLKAVQRALPLLKGTFAIAVIHRNHPEEMICAARESPLAIGIGEGRMYVASDAVAFLKNTRRAVYLHSSEVALVTAQRVQVFNADAMPITKQTEELTADAEEISKGTFQHFMLKEIFEQPQTIRNAELARFSQEYGTAILDELGLSDEELLQIERIIFIGCGTSYHAGLLGALMLEERAHIPVQVEISSEFRYKNPIVGKNTLAIALSQSGETADTLAAIRELREKGATILGICNVPGSTIAREVDSCLFLRAGPEVSVASTKAFTSQLTVIALFMLRLARMRAMSQQEGKEFIRALAKLPEQIKEVCALSDQIEQLAKRYAGYDNFFYLGRRFMYPTALEGALKLKEIAYINACGYPAGEMKHGPIALIHEGCPTVAFCSDSVTYPKILSNLMEIKARGGPILAVATSGSSEVAEIADDVIWVPPTLDELAPILHIIPMQFFAYYVARERGTEIDQPRNLAKSVTVE